MLFGGEYINRKVVFNDFVWRFVPCWMMLDMTWSLFASLGAVGLRKLYKDDSSGL